MVSLDIQRTVYGWLVGGPTISGGSSWKSGTQTCAPIVQITDFWGSTKGMYDMGH